MEEINKLFIKNLEIVEKTPIETFVPLKSGKDRVVVLYKYDTPLHLPDVENKHMQKFPLFDMYMFSSLGVIFCYLFTMEFKSIKLFDKYFWIKRPSAQYLDQFKNVALDYQSPFINVYSSTDGAALISKNGLSRIIVSSMVRKQKETDE